MMRSIGRSRGLRALSVLASACALALTAVLSPVAPVAPARAEDHKITAADEAYFSRYSLASLHAQGYTGEGVIIAVIDGYIDTSIPELQGADIQDKTPCTVNTDQDSNDHATYIAQFLVAPDFGVAPGRRFIATHRQVLREKQGRTAPSGVIPMLWRINRASSNRR